VTQARQTAVRRLGPGDEDVVRKPADREPRVERSDAVLWDYRYAAG
jgi:hypothetical protein